MTSSLAGLGWSCGGKSCCSLSSSCTCVCGCSCALCGYSCCCCWASCIGGWACIVSGMWCTTCYCCCICWCCCCGSCCIGCCGNCDRIRGTRMDVGHQHYETHGTGIVTGCVYGYWGYNGGYVYCCGHGGGWYTCFWGVVGIDCGICDVGWCGCW